MRLFDRVRGALPAHFSADDPAIPVIVADEIARQIDALPSVPGMLAWPAESYGVVAPPFQSFFVEVSTIIPGSLTGEPVTIQRGMLCAQMPLVEKERYQLPAGTYWRMSAEAFYYEPGFTLATYAGFCLVHMDKEGHLLDDMRAVKVAEHPLHTKAVKEGRVLELDAAKVAEHLVYTLKAISAMHRKCPVDHVTPPRQQRREVERKTGFRGTDYYVLKVKRDEAPRSFTNVGRPETRAPAREHIVAGHFAYYHPDRPLFGQPGRHGAIWVPEHTRGDKEAGRIEKDYEVGEE